MRQPIAGILTTVTLLWGILATHQAVQAQQGIVQSQTLGNGMAVTYRQDSTRKLMHLALTLRGGGSLDGRDAQGLAKVYEHLFFQSDHHAATTARQSGMYLSHKTFLESHFFGISLPSEQLVPALMLLADGLAATQWSDTTLQTAQAAIVPELQALENAPGYHLEADLRESLWRTFASRKQTAGNYATILRLGSAEILDAIAPYRHPGNCILTATGPEGSEAFFAAAEASLGAWSPLSAGALLPKVEVPQLASSIYFQTINEFASQPVIMIAWPVGSSTTPATQQQDASHFCTLAGLKLGRMYQQLVDSGLALDFSWRWEGGLNPGQMLLEVIPAKDRFPQCMRVLHDEIDRLDDADRYTKDEIAAANRLAQLQAAKTDDQSIPRLIAAGESWMLTQSDDTVQAPLTAERMRDFAATYLVAQPHVAGLLLNSAAVVAMHTDSVFQLSVTAVAAVEDPAHHGAAALHTIDPSVLRSFKILFKDDPLALDAGATKILQDIAAMLQDHPDKRIYLNSFSEGLGDGVKNYQLSIQRAKAMRQLLTETMQVDPRQVVIRAYGEAFPEYADDKDLRNRRMSFDYAPTNAQDNVF